MEILGHEIVGDGSHTVVVLHDWMGDHRNYDSVRPYLDESEHRWVFADLRGYGRSRARAGSFDLDEAAGDVRALIDHLGGPPPSLVGHSMSSLVAQQVAVEQALRSLVLVSPVDPRGMGTPDEVVAWLERVASDPSERGGLGERFAARHGPGWARFKLARWAESATPEAARAYVALFSRSQVEGGFPPDLPVAVLLGDEDAAPFEEETVRQAMAGAWPQATLHLCRTAGHYPMQETPVAFAAALQRVLA